MTAILDINNLHYVFPNKNGLFDVSLQLSRGDIYYLYGGRSSGKTLLLQLILGLLAPRSGSVNLMGENNAWQGNSRISYMPQQPRFVDRMNIRELLEYFSLLTGSLEVEFDKRLQIDISEKKPLYKLSLYTQKRVSLGIALLGNPDIVLLDEPFSGLDVQEAGRLSSLVSLLNTDKAISFLITGQNYEFASSICSRYGVMHKGRLIAQFTHEDLEERCKKCIMITTPHPEKAIPVLQQGYPRFEVLSDDLLRVFCPLSDSARINKALVQAGVDVKELWIAGMQPGEYLAGLTGDGDND